MINSYKTLHKMYVSLFEVHKIDPSIWTLQECNRIMTAIMAAKKFSWRVIGITPLALNQFAANEYRKHKNSGITRAHLTPRIKTVAHLILQEEPFSEDEFFNYWIANDLTVLCAKGENKETIPEYIEIRNDDGALFSCEKVLAGWKHRDIERKILKELHSKFLENQIFVKKLQTI